MWGGGGGEWGGGEWGGGGHDLPGRSYLSNDHASGCHPALLNGRYPNTLQSAKALSHNLAQSLVTEPCSKLCHGAKVCWIEN